MRTPPPAHSLEHSLDWSFPDVIPPWDQLPLDLFPLIALVGQLGIKDVLSMSQTCSTWRRGTLKHLGAPLKAWQEEYARCQREVETPKMKAVRQAKEQVKRERMDKAVFTGGGILSGLFAALQLTLALIGFILFRDDPNLCSSSFALSQVIASCFLLNFVFLGLWLLAFLTFGFGRPNKQEFLSAGAAFCIFNSLGILTNLTAFICSSVVVSFHCSGNVHRYCIATLVFGAIQTIAGIAAINLAWYDSYGQYFGPYGKYCRNCSLCWC
jgi:hypothetical protein